jgi:hypothetical protein
MTKIKPMTELEWRTSANAYRMLRHLQQHEGISRAPGAVRRLRLFAVACCRRVWPQFTDERCQQAIEVAERYADGRARKAELEEAAAIAEEADQAALQRATSRDPHAPASTWVPQHWARVLASIAQATTRTRLVVRWIQFLVGSLPNLLLIGTGLTRESAEFQQEEKALADLVRDIFGNPFQPAPGLADSWLEWNEATVVRLARAIYEERAFDRLPVLGDALEESGCSAPEILQHCRNPGPHARGCWLIDLLVGKS